MKIVNPRNFIFSPHFLQLFRKKAENGDFQVVGSLLYAHYPIYFFLLFEQYYQVLCCVKIQEKV